MRKEIKALITTVLMGAIILTTCGFTFTPSVTPDFSSGIIFNTTTQTTNLNNEKPAWYCTKKTVTDTIGVTLTGVVSTQTYDDTSSIWDKKLILKVDAVKFQEVNKAKVTVKWFDAKHSIENNSWVNFAIRYPNLSGVETTAKTISSQQTGLWREDSVVIEDYDFTKLNVLNPTAVTHNLQIITSAGAIDMGTPSTDDDYRGILINSITIEPMATYSISSINKLDNASLKLAATDIATNLEFKLPLKYPNVKTITDTNGVTYTGKASSDAFNNYLRMKLDVNKYANVKKARVTVRWFDAKHEFTNSSVVWSVRYSSGSTGPWGNYVKTSPNIQSGQTGLWRTDTVTIDDIDVSKLTQLEATGDFNLAIQTPKKNMNMGTPADTTDDFFGPLIESVTFTPIPEYSFSNLIFSDAQDKTLVKMTAGQPFYTNLTVSRSSGLQEADVTLVVCLYNNSSSMQLERISYQTQKMAANDQKTFEACFSAPEVVEGKVIKVMVWDSITGMNPISNAVLCE